jgi:hypothetical protein
MENQGPGRVEDVPKNTSEKLGAAILRYLFQISPSDARIFEPKNENAL